MTEVEGELSARLAVLDACERALEDCAHPYVNDWISWCNVCGAQRLQGVWVRPHWRDILAKVLVGR